MRSVPSIETFPVFIETELFKPLAVATLPARTKPFDVAEFFRRSSHSVTDGFRWFLGHSPSSVANTPAPARSYTVLQLKQELTTEAVCQLLPEERFVAIEDFAAFIESRSDVLNDTGPGYANLFFVRRPDGGERLFPVERCISRSAWAVCTAMFGETWNPNDRIICPGTAVL